MRNVILPQENAMLSDLDIYRAAHLMLHQYGDNAELEAAQCFDRMLRRDDCDELLTWFRIWRTIAAMRPGTHGPTTLTGRWAGMRTGCLGA
jgi:hypothetical protein